MGINRAATRWPAPFKSIRIRGLFGRVMKFNDREVIFKQQGRFVVVDRESILLYIIYDLLC